MTRETIPQASDVEIVAGRYALEQPLGNGGMGDVFVSTDRRLGRRVALKRLASGLADDRDGRERFLREARALARINDEHVVSVFDVGEDGGRPFLVMELIEGTTLGRVLAEHGALPPDRAMAIAAGAAGGLAAAHAEGVVHRDVKPSNIFLTRTDEAKVGDFGIARLERGDRTLTLTGAVWGSPAYVAPEQALGERVDGRADLYALGCVLYHMLAGHPPFRGDDPVALSYQHVHTEPPGLDAVGAPVSAELASLVARLLTKDPSDRPASASEVQRELEEQLRVEREPVTEVTDVLPPPEPEPEGPLRVPWRVLAVAGTAVFLVVLLAVALTRWGGDASSANRRSSDRRSPAASTAGSSAAVVTSAPAPSTPQQAVAALAALAEEMKSTGAIEPHLAAEIQHDVRDLVEHLDDPEEAAGTVGDLRESVAEGASEGTIAAADGHRLTVAIEQLAATLPAGSEGD